MKVLIAGLGSIGRKHVAAIREIDPNAEIFALRSKEGAEKEEGIQNIFSWKETPASLDFAVIATPTNLHQEDILQALSLRCPLIIEKPVLDSLERIQVLMEKIRETGMPTYVACNLRFHPVIQYLKDHLAGKERWNEVNIYCGSYLPEWRPGIDFRKIYSASEAQGGGVHLDLIHELDYCYWIWGYPQKTFRHLRSSSSLNIPATDYAGYWLDYSDFTAQITLNYFRRDKKRIIELVGENTTYLADLINCTITDHNGNILFKDTFNISQTYVEQIKYFIHCIQFNLPLMNDFREATDVLKICLSNDTTKS